MIVCYRKSDLQLVGTVPSNVEPIREIELNVLPNFGGNIEDYDYIETDEQYFRLEIIDGEIVVTKDKTPVFETPPTLEDKIAANMDYLLDVDYRLIMVELGMA